MSNKIERIASFRAKSSDLFFFDNSVWMYLLCPIGNHNFKRQQTYSNFFSSLLSNKSHIYTNSLVLSEFSNRYLRMDFDIEKRKPGNIGHMINFKRDYLPTSRARSVIQDVKTNMKKIYDFCQKSSDEFNSINFTNLLALFSHIGFNDSYYAEQSSNKKWILVTDDSDLAGGSLPDKNLHILTA
jgi:predicted nucleic acid-binding protein